jgi:hypothetical protein
MHYIRTKLSDMPGQLSFGFPAVSQVERGVNTAANGGEIFIVRRPQGHFVSFGGKQGRLVGNNDVVTRKVDIEILDNENAQRI